MTDTVTNVLDDIQTWGIISTSVPGVVSVVGLCIVIVIVVQLKKLQRSIGDLTRNIRTVESDLKSLAGVTIKKGDELTGSFQRLETTVSSSLQSFQSQLLSVSSPRSEYNDELMNINVNRGGLLPTRAVGPPVPPKRANSYYKSTYY